MSGGAYNYNQYKIQEIVDYIQERLDKQGKEIPKKSSHFDDDNYEIYPMDIQESFKKGIALLKEAQIYAHRIDWYFSSDDGEDSFRKRLKEDLEQLKK